MIPEHYSRDIAQRCRYLVRHLRPVVQQGLPGDKRFGGPLGTTFLLALATPMIILPIERIFKPALSGTAQAGDDRQLDPVLAHEVADVLGPGRTFGAAPFSAPGAWSYIPHYQPFNVADIWPADLLHALATEDAHDNAERAAAARVLCDLRNALAHGAIAYLDADGQQTHGDAAMLAFAGARLRDHQLVGLNILRIREDDFCAFLMKWADWLCQPKIRDVLNARGPFTA